MVKPKFTKLWNLLLALFCLVLATSLVQGSRIQSELSYHPTLSNKIANLQGRNMKEVEVNRNSRRLMIGSTRPICTYNECRGCRHRCIAEQVPVEGNDPMNSAYHYRCVCHR